MDGLGFTERATILVVDDTPDYLALKAQELPFQPFTQRHSRLARRYEGEDLGLTMVKRLAELPGGAVAVRSEPKMGSTCTVWLPRRTEDDQRTVRKPRVLALTG